MPEVPTSTLADVDEPAVAGRTNWRRRSLLALIAVVVIVGATGFLGVKTATVSASEAGYDLTVVYPHVARAGLDIPWRATVTHSGGFDGPVTLAVSTSYFDIFETQGFHPQPSAETADPHFVYLTFNPPRGDRLSVSFDTYVQPSAQLGRSADTAVVVHGIHVATVHYRTWLVP
jgi:hypothetical protein